MKKRVYLLLLVVLVSVWALPVHAKGLEGFYVNDNVTLNDSIDSTAFIAGNSVDVKSNINGLAFVAGNTVNVGSDQEHLFVAGNLVTITNANTKDLFAAGSKVTLSNSTVRDLYAAAAEVYIDSNVERNAFIGGDTVNINSKIGGDVRVSSSNLIIGKDAEITGTLYYPEDAKLDKAEGSIIGKTKTYKSPEVEISNKTIVEIAVAGIIDFIKTVLSMVVVGLLLLLTNKKLFADLDKEARTFENIAKKCGLGFAVLFLTPIVALITLFTIVGTPIGIIGLIFYGILFYLSAIPTAYFVGKWVFGENIKGDYLLLMVSIIILYVINRVPVLGGITTFLSLCIGLGFYTSLIYNYMTNKEETKKTSEKKSK